MNYSYFILDGVDNVLNEETTVMLGDNLEYTVMNPKNGIASPIFISIIILVVSIIVILVTNNKKYFIKI